MGNGFEDEKVQWSSAGQSEGRRLQVQFVLRTMIFRQKDSAGIGQDGIGWVWYMLSGTVVWMKGSTGQYTEGQSNSSIPSVPWDWHSQ
jgi:hypothetical protein